MRTPDFFATHPVFTHEAFLAAHAEGRERSPRTADSLLMHHVKAGRLLHLRRGLYAVVPTGAKAASFQVDPFLLATQLAPDATLAFHAALQYRGKAYSVWHRFTVLTGSHLRSFSFQGCDYVGVQWPKILTELPETGGGFTLEDYAGGRVRATTLERTFVEALESPELTGGWEEVWRSLEMIEYFDLEAVLEQTLQRNNALTTAKVGFFLSLHRARLFVENRHLETLRLHSPRQPRYFDSHREPGRLVKDWNLIVPERVLSRSWEEIS